MKSLNKSIATIAGIGTNRSFWHKEPNLSFALQLLQEARLKLSEYYHKQRKINTQKRVENMRKNNPKVKNK